MDAIKPGAPVRPPHTGTDTTFKPFGDRPLGFRDLLDIINPLHHIPVVGNLYRKITGDVIQPAFRVAGGALFGGPLGAAFAAASVVVGELIGGSGERFPERASPPTPQRPQVAPGGWMVATTRSFDRAAPLIDALVPDTALAARDPAPARRGGWLVAAAYAMADARHADEARFEVDTLA